MKPSRGGQDYWILKLNPENLTTTIYSSLKANIYPNPTTGTLNINFGQVLNKANLTLTNVLGQSISNYSISNSDKFVFEINEPNGIYFLEIESQNKTKQVVKIIKQ